MNQILNKLERKFGQYAIPNLMTIMVFGMALVFLIDTFIAANPDYEYYLSDLLYFNKDLILQGEAWRVITFLFLPGDYSPLWIVFTLYFDWLVGKSLENEWGSFRFNVFYFLGAVGSILGGIITGWATNGYLNASLFLAFATLFPDFEILIFFILPVKVKYLGMLSAAALLYSLIVYPLPYKIAILISLINFLLFFGKDFYQRIRMFIRRKKYQKQNQNNWKNNHWWDDKNHPWKK